MPATVGAWADTPAFPRRRTRSTSPTIYRDYKTKTPKPEAEHAIMVVDPIVSEADFRAVQEVLKSRSWANMPLRA